MPHNHQDWQRVADEINARFQALQLTKAELIKRSGVSFKSLTGYMEGKPIHRVDKRRDLSLALGWTAHSIDRILQGDPPLDAAPGGPTAESSITSSFLTGDEYGQIAHLRKLADEHTERIAWLEAQLSNVVDRLNRREQEGGALGAIRGDEALTAARDAISNALIGPLGRRPMRQLKVTTSDGEEVTIDIDHIQADKDDLALAAEGDQDKADEIRKAPRRSRPHPE